MILKKIQKNETVKFRVPAVVAEQIRLIKSECVHLGWKFELNDEIAQLIEKQCRKALAEIQIEHDLRKQSSSDDSAVETKTARTKPQKPKPLPIMDLGKSE